MTHKVSQRCIAHECAHERDLYLTTRVAASGVALQQLIQTFKDERPEPIHRPIILDLVEDVCEIVMIRFYIVRV